MSRFKLDDLNVDCLRDMLKYVTLKDRVRFERVNKKWRDVTDSLWRSQTTLNIGRDGNVIKFENECGIRNHEVRFLRDTVLIELYPSNGPTMKQL